MGKFGKTKNVRGKTEVALGIKTVEGVVQKWLVFICFIREKLEQGREFRSEDLQEENNEREARKIQHNQLIIQNKQMQA